MKCSSVSMFVLTYKIKDKLLGLRSILYLCLVKYERCMYTHDHSSSVYSQSTMVQFNIIIVSSANKNENNTPNYMIIWLDKHIGSPKECVFLKSAFFMTLDPTTGLFERDLNKDDIDHSICMETPVFVRLDDVEFIFQAFVDIEKKPTQTYLLHHFRFQVWLKFIQKHFHQRIQFLFSLLISLWNKLMTSNQRIFGCTHS